MKDQMLTSNMETAQTATWDPQQQSHLLPVLLQG